ncbi:MAG TPA: diacylglycerol kinase [Thauera aminoaromatica]|nr:diacylglycerol kinase [Thauera aminoaromatica]
MRPPAKGLPFSRRVRFAWAGVRDAWRLEASFRSQCLAALAALVALAVLRPGWLWSAIVVVMIALVLAAELINTALEAALDGLHPEHARFVQVAKDCAAAAVLVLSGASVVAFACMLADLYG